MRNSRWATQASCFLLSCAITSVALPAQTLTTLHSFEESEGHFSFGSLLQAKNGNFYGTMNYGGAHTYGTVFEITPEGGLATLHSFDQTDGQQPKAGLVLGADGDFYGTTSVGGSAFDGTIFKITAGGNFTKLHSVSRHKDGAEPDAPLVKGRDGNFYGTTSSGGPHGGGTVFKITPEGALTTLYGFCAQTANNICIDGDIPLGALVQGANGNFYGTTDLGGTHDAGTVFEVTAAGKLTTLHSFSGTGEDGNGPPAGLVLASNGNFYGTTAGGGAHSHGTIFEMTPAGALTTIHSFAGADGAGPSGSLIQATNRNIYGVTLVGGTQGDGAIFEITLSGKLTTLYSFGSHKGDGANPWAGLVQGMNGDLYGTTLGRGSFGDGTFFKLSLDK